MSKTSTAVDSSPAPDSDSILDPEDEDEDADEDADDAAGLTDGAEVARNTPSEPPRYEMAAGCAQIVRRSGVEYYSEYYI